MNPTTLLALAAALFGFNDLTWGLILLGLGVVLYIVETTNPGFFIAIPGTVLLVAGFIMIVSPGLFQQPWSWLIIIAVSILATWASIQIYKRIAPPEKSNTTIGIQNVVGLVGVADTDVTPERGEVRIQGEAWRAKTAAGIVTKGAKVQVVGTEGGLTVIVQPATG
jgi:membrane-bound ClpP family serine protease